VLPLPSADIHIRCRLRRFTATRAVPVVFIQKASASWIRRDRAPGLLLIRATEDTADLRTPEPWAQHAEVLHVEPKVSVTTRARPKARPSSPGEPKHKSRQLSRVRCKHHNALSYLEGIFFRLSGQVGS